MKRAYVGGLVLAAFFNVFAQTKVDLGAQAKNIDLSQAASVRPFPTGSVLPATCSVGQVYFLTVEPVGANECVAPDTWTAIQGGSGNGHDNVLDVKRTSPTQLTIGSSCSVTNSCVIRIGSIVHILTAPATATVSSGGGTAYIYIDGTGNIVTGVSSANISCSGCQVIGAITQYPIATIPLATWNVTNGTWDPTGSNDTALLAAPPVLTAGANITITQSGGNVTIAGTASGGTGGSGGGTGTGGPVGTYYNPTDPTQWFRDHISISSGFASGQDAWSYSGSCAQGSGSGATGFTRESFLSATWLAASQAGTECFYYFPTLGNSAYGGGTYDYWSGDSPSQLWVSAVYKTTDANGNHYVGLGANNQLASNFIGCRQKGSGNWFAVIRTDGVDVSVADTGVPHDAEVHRLVVDNNSGTPNTIRCTVDGGTPATASGAIPAQTFGWVYFFGVVAIGAPSANVAPYQYTIFLQGLPRL